MEKILFDRYEYIKEIGRGGFGSVLLCRDRNLEKLCAVKVSEDSPQSTQEVNILKSLRHEGLPIVYDHRKVGTTDYMIMEYVDGITLNEHIKRSGKMSEDLVKRYTGRIADMIQALHENTPAIIYRDLKSENIMVTMDGELKLIDFGSAYIKGYNGMIMRDNFSTRGYGAPELFRGMEAKASSDIYSIGVIMYEMLKGEVIDKDFIPERDLYTLSGKCDRGLFRVMEKALKSDPSLRYVSISEFRRDLDMCKDLGLTRKVSKAMKLITLLSAYLTTAVCMFGAVFVTEDHSVRVRDLGYVNLKIPLLLLSCSILLTLCLTPKKKDRKGSFITEKEILIAQKRYFVIRSLVFVIAGILLNSLLQGAGLDVFASSGERELFVEMRDPSEKKLLIKNGGEYRIDDRVRFEISSKDLPQDELRIKILAVDDNGNRYLSRDFKIAKTDDDVDN